MDWLSRIMDVDPSQWSRRDWAVLGTHHAQALVARHLSRMERNEWQVFRRAVIAGARHEYFRLAMTKEGAYWASFVTMLDASPKGRTQLMGTLGLVA